jgi:DNA repair protein RadA/Sms
VFHEVALAPDMVAIGEVGLTGEIRRVGAMPKRLAEAARLGFRFALVPPGCGPAATGQVPAGMQVREVGDMLSALRASAQAGVAATDGL